MPDWLGARAGIDGFQRGSTRGPAKQRYPCNGAKPPVALRARKCASGRAAMREARVPVGQHRNAAPSGARSAGQSASARCSRSASCAPDRPPDGPGLQARCASTHRTGCRQAASNGSIGKCQFVGLTLVGHKFSGPKNGFPVRGRYTWIQAIGKFGNSTHSSPLR